MYNYTNNFILSYEKRNDCIYVAMNGTQNGYLHTLLQQYLYCAFSSMLIFCMHRIPRWPTTFIKMFSMQKGIMRGILHPTMQCIQLDLLFPVYLPTSFLWLIIWSDFKGLRPGFQHLLTHKFSRLFQSFVITG